jgi:excisionase family DNA binding protein
MRPEVAGRKAVARSARKPIAERLVYSVPEAGRLLGLGRNAAYEAAKRGDIPTIRMGRLLRVPKVPFHRMLGMIAADMAAEETEPELPRVAEANERIDPGERKV